MIKKVNEIAISRDEKSRKCNCSSASLINDGLCVFNSRCREKCVVYKATCTTTNKFYIGKTSQFLKERFRTHFNDTQSLANLLPSQEDSVPSSTLSRHLAENVSVEDPDVNPVRAADVRKIVNVEVLWKGDPINCSNSFGEVKCKLCMMEKIFIFKNNCKHPRLILNRGYGIHSECSCRKRKKFHILENRLVNTPCLHCTDEGNPERRE